MSYPRLSEDLYVNYWDLHGHDQGSLLRGVRKGVMASAVSVLLIAGLVTAAFEAVETCWVCGGRTFRPMHDAIFELSEYLRQDPELAAYSGASVCLQQCRACGTAHPAFAQYCRRCGKKL